MTHALWAAPGLHGGGQVHEDPGIPLAARPASNRLDPAPAIDGVLNPGPTFTGALGLSIGVEHRPKLCHHDRGGRPAVLILALSGEDQNVLGQRPEGNSYSGILPVVVY